MTILELILFALAFVYLGTITYSSWLALMPPDDSIFRPAKNSFASQGGEVNPPRTEKLSEALNL